MWGKNLRQLDATINFTVKYIFENKINVFILVFTNLSSIHDGAF